MSLDIGKVAIALLGLLAYKNKDKIGELIAGRNSTDAKNAGSTGGLGDILERLRMRVRAIKSIPGLVQDRIAPFRATKSRKRSTRKR